MPEDERRGDCCQGGQAGDSPAQAKLEKGLV